jgi:hypothetical protein
MPLGSPRLAEKSCVPRLADARNRASIGAESGSVEGYGRARLPDARG